MVINLQFFGGRGGQSGMSGSSGGDNPAVAIGFQASA